MQTHDPAIRVKSNLETSTQEVLAGLVERVTFHNAENGFCVLRAKARGHRDLVTVVGHAATISAGEWITASGEWINDRSHGQQFKARFLKTSAPSSIDGIEKYREWKESGLQAARRRSTTALSRPSNTAARTVATQCAPRGDHRIRCFLAMRALAISSTQPSAREVEIGSLEP